MKTKRNQKASFKSLALVDIHFHGAFGVDLMSAQAPQLTELSCALAQNGIGAFCPTTLSMPKKPLKEAVTRLGKWIRGLSAAHRGATPIGIHLEGPFINPKAAGAHESKSLRHLNFAELESLWEASQKTLKIITLAPELLNSADFKKVTTWAKKNGVILSIGHSHASESQTCEALCRGFGGITHAWNAMNFHHRSPGVMAGALGHPDTYLELIVDGIHVSPTVMRWTLALHGAENTCMVSDCAPAAATQADSGIYHPFGNLKVTLKQGASRLPNGGLAGGGMLLSEAFANWVTREARLTGVKQESLLKDTIDCVSANPLRFLKIPKSSPAWKHQMHWLASEDPKQPLGYSQVL